MPKPPPLLVLQRLSKCYQEGEVRHPVFRDLDLELAQGDSLALVGRSGSGKTTLLNLISGIDLPDSGEVLIGDTRITALSEQARTLFRRRHIGFVFQFFNLLPTLTVLENVLLPLELNGVRNGRPRAAALLEQVGLGDRLDSYPDRLSGGEQQRVAIARAIVHRPVLLLADEPTGNLDEETSARVLDLFGELVRESSTTLVLVTHSQDVARLARRIYALRDGRLLETASVAGEPR